jgi:hypothetical protein
MFFRRAGELSDKLLTVAIVLWIKLDRCDDHKNAPLGAILRRRAPNSRAPGQRMTEITTHTRLMFTNARAASHATIRHAHELQIDADLLCPLNSD